MMRYINPRYDWNTFKSRSLYIRWYDIFYIYIYIYMSAYIYEYLYSYICRSHYSNMQNKQEQQHLLVQRPQLASRQKIKWAVIKYRARNEQASVYTH